MPGKSILILLLGMILISGLIISGILRTSNSISKNMVNDYQRKTANNIAQSGANIGLNILRNNSNYRNPSYSVSNFWGDHNKIIGQVNVRVIDTSLSGIGNVVAVKSTGYTNYGTPNQISYTSIAFTPNVVPSSLKGSYTSNSIVSMNGTGLVDGRNHDLNGTVIPNSGTYAIWSTSTVTLNGNGTVYGTPVGSNDIGPLGKNNTSDPNYHLIVLENQTYPGNYPVTPDQIMGGASSGYPEGTLKSKAQSGVGGSHYVPINGSLPTTMSGITFVDLNSSTNGLNMNGSGILVLNNTTLLPLTIKLLDGAFTGVVILANNFNIDKLHGDIIGAFLTTSVNPVGNVAINGTGSIKYSSQALQNAFNNFMSAKIVWFEH
jgi:hypothetical protein